MISHGHTARGALQTSLLGRLVDSGNRVTVVTMQDPDGELKTEVEKQGGSLEVYAPIINRRLEQLNFLRSYVHQDIRTNPALWEKHQRRAIDKNSSFRRRAMNSIYLRLGDFIRCSKWFQRRFKNLEQKQYEDKRAFDLVSRLSPDAIISTRPVDPMEAFLLNAARRIGILRIMYLLSWDNITSKGFFPETADQYLTWGPVMNDELEEFYQVQDEQMFLTGVTHFDVHHNVRESQSSNTAIESLGLNGDLPYLFFTMSASYFAPNEIDVIEFLANRIEENSFGPDMQLVVRPHMANLMSDRSDESWLSRLQKLPTKRVKVNFPETKNDLLTWYMAQDDMIQLSSLLNGASVCLNSGSTIAIEALYLDRPVVITAFDTQPQKPWGSAKRVLDYVHLKKLFETGACRLVEDLTSMESAVKDYLKNPEKDSLQRRQAVEMECYKNDGNSTFRFVENINEILSNNQ